MTRIAALALLACIIHASHAQVPCQSGPQPGQRPGPYAFLVATGQQRGQAHCFVCEAADRPCIIVFARSATEPLGKLLAQVDRAVLNHKPAELRAWATILADNQPELDPQLVQWSRLHALSNVPVGVFEDPIGPPSYRLHRDADVTVLLSVHQKVVANFALRRGELTEEKIKEIVGAVPKLIPIKSP